LDLKSEDDWSASDRSVWWNSEEVLPVRVNCAGVQKDLALADHWGLWPEVAMMGLVQEVNADSELNGCS
jgi:hypothetical protein